VHDVRQAKVVWSVYLRHLWRGSTVHQSTQRKYGKCVSGMDLNKSLLLRLAGGVCNWLYGNTGSVEQRLELTEQRRDTKCVFNWVLRYIPTIFVRNSGLFSTNLSPGDCVTLVDGRIVCIAQSVRVVMPRGFVHQERTELKTGCAREFHRSTAATIELDFILPIVFRRTGVKSSGAGGDRLRVHYSDSDNGSRWRIPTDYCTGEAALGSSYSTRT